MRTLYAFSLSSLLSLTTLLLSCSGSQKDDVAGGFSDETETTELTGMLVDSDGRPQANALVVLRQDFRSAEAETPIASLASFETYSDDEGRFSFDSVSPGQWNLDARTTKLGSLQKVVCSSKSVNIGPDTLKQLTNVVYHSDKNDKQAIFLPQTNQILPLVANEALLSLPVGTIEIILLDSPESQPAPGMTPESFEILPGPIAWNQLFTFEFLPSDPWDDEVGGITHLQNVATAPAILQEGLARFNGNTCFKIISDRDYSFPQFQFSTRASFEQPTSSVQTLACARGQTGEPGWCLRSHGADSLVFWYSQKNASPDSLVLSGISTTGWALISVSVTENQIELGVADQDTVSQQVSIDLSSNTEPIFLGCSLDDTTPVEFLKADIDWFSLENN